MLMYDAVLLMNNFKSLIAILIIIYIILMARLTYMHAAEGAGMVFAAIYAINDVAPEAVIYDNVSISILNINSLLLILNFF